MRGAHELPASRNAKNESRSPRPSPWFVSSCGGDMSLSHESTTRKNDLPRSLRINDLASGNAFRPPKNAIFRFVRQALRSREKIVFNHGTHGKHGRKLNIFVTTQVRNISTAKNAKRSNCSEGTYRGKNSPQRRGERREIFKYIFLLSAPSASLR